MNAAYRNNGGARGTNPEGGHAGPPLQNRTPRIVEGGHAGPPLQNRARRIVGADLCVRPLNLCVHAAESNPHARRNTSGFGLVELLVAIAIFISIIAAIGFIFNGSLRSLRQAEQNQEIFEMVRGAMQVMERDLTNAFASREHGDVYEFYGTPIGFTFVGLVKTHPSDQPNIARVTYVLRRDTGRVLDRNNLSDYVDAAGNVVSFDDDNVDNDGDDHTGPGGLRGDGIDNDGDALIDELAGIDPNGDNEGVDEPGEGVEVLAFSLVRYIERGVDNLETFPVDWTAALLDDALPGTFPDTLGDIVGSPETIFDSPDATLEDPSFVQQAVVTGLCRQDDLRCLREVEKAARRQIWIAMLAGQTAPITGLRDYFDDIAADPEDYILIDNIEVANMDQVFPDIEGIDSARGRIQISTGPLGEFDSVAYNGQFFQYVEWVDGVDVSNLPTVHPSAMSFWNDSRNIRLNNNGIDDNTSNNCCDDIDNDGDRALLDGDGLDNDGDGLIDEGNDALDNDGDNAALEIDGINNDLDGQINGVDDDLNPATGDELEGIIDEANEGVDEPDESEGIDEYDERAMLIDCDVDEVIAGLDGDGLDNDGDGIIDCEDTGEYPHPLQNDGVDNDNDGSTDEADEWNFAPGPGPGSPLSAAIPQQLQVRFRLFYESPIAGAADFQRNFAFDIEIPSGTRRTNTTE